MYETDETPHNQLNAVQYKKRGKNGICFKINMWTLNRNRKHFAGS